MFCPRRRPNDNERGCIVAERRFKSTVRSDCFREEGRLTKEGEKRSGYPPFFSPSLLRRNPLYLSLNTYFEVVSRRDYGSGHGRGRDGTPPLRGSENVPLSRDEQAAEVGRRRRS